ncbi:hypothetical protein [Nocardioides sp. TF02-7]|uniref:hypothetical protein n=1 Tax=Nocardioides sp. TF02-7 TaxID=2917724 RepID=UPI001F065AB7|nr:hypothetical protein [Nocardioides sp. TF02-7]UMG91483.1 hypothetical protein MF408_15305 [Nocardioides sp. TF02-7]
MRVLNVVGGSLLWVLAGLLGLVGVLLSVTIVLLPLGIPLLWLARKLFRTAMALLVPRPVRHPVSEAGKAVEDGAGSARKGLSKAAGRGRSFLERQRKRLP